MMHINFVISLIKQTEKVMMHRSLKISLMHKQLCLYMNSLRSLSNRIVEEINIDDDKDNVNKEILKEKVIDEWKTKISNIYKDNMSIVKYINIINPELAKICPKKHIKVTNMKENIFYLIDKSTAKKFVQLIIDDLSKDMNFVAENNAGIGLLTEELLNAGIKKIYAYETNNCFYPALNKLKDKYPDRLEIRNGNLSKMSILHYLDEQDNKNRINEVLNGTPVVPWENESTFMQVIAVTTNIKFFKHLILALVFRTSFMKFGRPSFYLAIPPSMWSILSNPNNRATMHSIYVFFKTTFNFKHLGDIERISWTPWEKQMLKRKIRIHDHEIFKVIKIEPKADLFNNYLQSKELVPYWYFIKYHLTIQDQRVIPEIEKWIPGSGIRLIRMDYNIFTRFIDLTPIQFFNLYKEFVSWPEFESCLFLSSAYSYIQSISTKLTDNQLIKE
ncbi:hypothetical protein M0802_008467 [Mischocyttarus mexicanus]|nr:hypothetical protein M0802_008467 [Mischocyttarus mexicanus]